MCCIYKHLEIMGSDIGSWGYVLGWGERIGWERRKGPAWGGSQWPDWASWVLEWTRTRVDYNPLNEIESRSSYLQWWRERERKAFPWSWMLTQSRTKDGTSKLLPLTLLGLIDSGRNIKMLHWGVPWQLSRLRIWRGCSWVAAVVRVPGPETYTHTPKKNIILSGVGD